MKWVKEKNGKVREYKEVECAKCKEKRLVRKERSPLFCIKCRRIKEDDLFITSSNGERYRAKINKCTQCGDEFLIKISGQTRIRCKNCHIKYLHELQIGKPSHSKGWRKPNAKYKDREYLRKQQTERYKKFRKYVIQLKGNKCFRCGANNLPIAVYELHHRDPKVKDMTISEARAKSWTKFVEEMEKCELVCCNCHRIIHSTFSEETLE